SRAGTSWHRRSRRTARPARGASIASRRAAVADTHATEQKALAGGGGAVQAQRGSGNDAGHGDRAGRERGTLEKLPAGEGSHAGSGGGGADCANFWRRFLLRHGPSLPSPVPQVQKFSGTIR